MSKKVTQDVLQYVLEDLKVYIDTKAPSGGNGGETGGNGGGSICECDGSVSLVNARLLSMDQEVTINKWIDKNTGAN